MTVDRTVLAGARHRWRSAGVASAPRLRDVLDDAARALESLAQSILDAASRVLRDVKSASHTEVSKQAYVDRSGVEDRAWRFSYHRNEVFCIVDDMQERALLDLIVGGAPSGRLSEIERRIVGEAIGQLLRSSALEDEICEELRVRPQPPTWLCKVELSGSNTREATLTLFTPCTPAPLPRIVRPNLDSVSIPLRAAFLPHPYELGPVSKWERGCLVRLHRGQLPPDAYLYAGGRQIARGRLGSLFGERAVLITELTVPAP